jgi:hypothetical protein
LLNPCTACEKPQLHRPITVHPSYPAKTQAGMRFFWNITVNQRKKYLKPT